MAEPFIAEIHIFPYNFAPRDWAFCNGQIMPIPQNTALFALLGTTYGGDGKTNFALPNLQGRAPMHWGQGPGLSNRGLGESDGETTVTLTAAQLASHTHPFTASGDAGTTNDPTGNVPAAALGRGNFLYAQAPQPVVPMDATAVTPVGGGQAHNNMQPFLALNFCIALQGYFPPRS